MRQDVIRANVVRNGKTSKHATDEVPPPDPFFIFYSAKGFAPGPQRVKG